MAISDVYTVDSAPISIASTAQSPILEVRTTATKRAFIVGVRVKVGKTSAAAGNTSLFTLARAGVVGTGGAAPLLRPHDSASAAAFTVSATPAYTIAPTLGNILAEWILPETTGSMWEEFPPLGYEWVVPISASVAVFVTNTDATSTPMECQLIISE